MPLTVIRIRTWRCPSCDYAQDFDPDDAQQMALHFPTAPAGQCPACCFGQNLARVKQTVKMRKEADPAKKSTMTVQGQESIDSEIAQIEKVRVMSESEKDTYRTDRLGEITDAIAAAR